MMHAQPSPYVVWDEKKTPPPALSPSPSPSASPPPPAMLSPSSAWSFAVFSSPARSPSVELAKVPDTIPSVTRSSPSRSSMPPPLEGSPSASPCLDRMEENQLTDIAALTELNNFSLTHTEETHTQTQTQQQTGTITESLVIESSSSTPRGPAPESSFSALYSALSRWSRVSLGPVPVVSFDYSLLPPQSKLTPLFKRVLTSKFLHAVSATLILYHCLLFYVAVFGFYLLFAQRTRRVELAGTAASALPTTAVWGFNMFFVLLLFRSILNIFLLAYRVRVPELWVNEPGSLIFNYRLHMVFQSCQRALRFWSLVLFLFTAVLLIASTGMKLQEYVDVLVLSVLVFEFTTMMLSLIYMAVLWKSALPRRHIHWCLPYLPAALPRPVDKHSGLSSATIARLPLTTYHSHSINENDTEVCAVCLVELCDGDQVRILSACQHTFHQQCIDQWLNRRASCPLCVRTVNARKKSKSLASSTLKIGMESPATSSTSSISSTPSISATSSASSPSSVQQQ